MMHQYIPDMWHLGSMDEALYTSPKLPLNMVRMYWCMRVQRFCRWLLLGMDACGLFSAVDLPLTASEHAESEALDSTCPSCFPSTCPYHDKGSKHGWEHQSGSSDLAHWSKDWSYSCMITARPYYYCNLHVKNFCFPIWKPAAYSSSSLMQAWGYYGSKMQF